MDTLTLKIIRLIGRTGIRLYNGFAHSLFLRLFDMSLAGATMIIMSGPMTTGEPYTWVIEFDDPSWFQGKVIFYYGLSRIILVYGLIIERLGWPIIKYILLHITKYLNKPTRI